MSRWQAVVFDLDDTLYPERDYVLSGFRAVATWAETRLGIPRECGFEELRTLFEQGIRGGTFDRWLTTHQLPLDHWIPELVRIYREHHPSLTCFPCVPELLASLRLRYRLGLLSDGYLAVQQRKVAALGLSSSFDAIVFSDEWGRDAWKPSPKPFEAVLQRLGVGASRTLYVADNPLKDFIGARHVGIFGIWVRWGGEHAFHEPPTILHAPDCTIGSLVDLEQTLLQLESQN